jgi:hypothetical protein
MHLQQSNRIIRTLRRFESGNSTTYRLDELCEGETSASTWKPDGSFYGFGVAET